jgi:two-component system, LytTR family, response regulator AlgR
MSHTVVIADDEAPLRFLLALMLERDGRFAVVAQAGDGQQALRAVAEHDPDLLLLDLGLPRLDGLEVLRHLQASSRPATVVLTGFTDRATHDHARALGAVTCLVKGTDFVLVADTLHRAGCVRRGDDLSL